jgi:hypothetical protein
VNGSIARDGSPAVPSSRKPSTAHRSRRRLRARVPRPPRARATLAVRHCPPQSQ